MTNESGLDRRDALKTLLALGAAAPLAWTGTLPAQATGLCCCAWRNCWITEAIWVSLEMFPPKKITPAAWPALICCSRANGGVSPE